MKTKTAVSTKKQSVALKDLKTRKNPKGGASDPVPGIDVVARKKPCWVAREVYGAENPAWRQFRDWLLGSGSAEFVNFYKTNGAEISREIARQPKTKELIRHLMDAVIPNSRA
jgi:hypothetical protein